MKINQAYLDIQLWKVLENELSKYNKQIKDLEDSNSKTLNDIMFYKKGLQEALLNISKNPSKENTAARINKLNNFSKSNEPVKRAMNYYLTEQLSLKGLGHTDAWIYLSNKSHTNLLKNEPIEEYSFELKHIPIKRLYEVFINSQVINPKTDLKAIETAFNGSPISSIEEVEFTLKQKNHIVYLFDELNNRKLINYKYVNNNKLIALISGISNISSQRDNYQNNKSISSLLSKGKPRHSKIIDEIVDTLINGQ
jgi:hypothetical protein